MNFEKSKVLLKKINALHQAADEGMGVSTLEKDLMLQYVRDFYESIKEEPKNTKKEPAKPTPPIIEKYIPEPPSIPKPIPAHPVHVAAISNAKPIETTMIESKTSSKISEELSSLFSESKKEENSSRYAGGRITDIGKSMGINDKILTINELFKGDQSLFNRTVDHLNSLSNFDEAKQYIAFGVAEKLNWSDANKKGKAIRFINLMRRRYTS